MSDKATLDFDGVEIEIKAEGEDITITVADNEPIHLSNTGAMALALSLIKVIESTEEE